VKTGTEVWRKRRERDESEIPRVVLMGSGFGLSVLTLRERKAEASLPVRVKSRLPDKWAERISFRTTGKKLGKIWER